MKKLIICDYLLPISSSYIKKACLLIDDYKVIDFGSYFEIKKKYSKIYIEDWSNYLIMPGWVNSHTHLELSSLENKIKSFSSFTDWIRQIIQLKSELTKTNIISGIKKGIKLLWDSGVVALGDISSEFLSYKIMSESFMLGRVFWEYLALRDEDIKNRYQNLIKSIENIDNNLIKTGISPHSPYSLSKKSFEKILFYIRSKSLHSTIHVSESIDEVDFFQKKKGSLANFLEHFIDLNNFSKSKSPLSYLYQNSFLEKDMLIAHLNFICEKDILILQKLNLSVVHCPMSHYFFDHPRFPLELLLKNRIPICLGTDSLASNYKFSFFKEIRQLKKIFPQLKAQLIIQMATINGAYSLKLFSGIGEIKKGNPYFLIALKINSNIDNPYEWILNYEGDLIHIRSNI